MRIRILVAAMLAVVALVSVGCGGYGGGGGGGSKPHSGTTTSGGGGY
jgi:hypothetical protein